MSANNLNIIINFSEIQIRQQDQQQSKTCLKPPLIRPKKRVYSYQDPKIKKLKSKKIEPEAEDNLQEYSENLSQLLGAFLIILGATFFVFTMYSLFFAKDQEISEYIIIKFMRLDYHFCYLVPMLIPVTFVFAYTNWISMKFFRHC
jgi:phosphatidylinositol glycan anchor class Y biosynthesis protein